MLIEKELIQNFLPQRPPFVMIDCLVDANDAGFLSSFQIAEDNLFLQDGVLSESALIENIAQTCAAGFGYVGSQRGEEAGRLGFIGAVSRLSVSSSAKLGDEVQTRIELLNAFDSIHLVQGTASVDGKTVLECQLKIVLG